MNAKALALAMEVLSLEKKKSYRSSERSGRRNVLEELMQVIRSRGYLRA